jgi:uncharacterized protein
MHPSVEQLLRVQEVDSEIIFLRESLRLRPRELDDDRKKVSDRQKAIEDLAAQVKRLKLDGDRREVDVKKADSEIVKLTVVMNQAKSNQEYTIFKEQIKRQEEMRSKAEEEVLGKLSDIDALESNRKVFVERLEQETRSLKKKEAELSVLVKSLQGQLGELEKKHEALVEGIDKEHLKIYERVLARHNNTAMARVDSQICHGCYISVTPQEVNLLLQSQFLQCRSCGRILFLI